MTHDLSDTKDVPPQLEGRPWSQFPMPSEKKSIPKQHGSKVNPKWIQSESKVNPKWINLLRLFKILVEQQLQKPSLNDLLGSSPDAPHRPRVPGHNAQQCPTGNAIDQGGGWWTREHEQIEEIAMIAMIAGIYIIFIIIYYYVILFLTIHIEYGLF